MFICFDLRREWLSEAVYLTAKRESAMCGACFFFEELISGGENQYPL